MSFLMVFGMEVYNHIMAANSFHIRLLFIPFLELCLLMAIVIALQTFIARPLAVKLARRFVNPAAARPFALVLAMQVATVLLMCPMMSLVATLVFKNGLSGRLFQLWLQTMALNFPMALVWQIAVAGPVTRFAVSRMTTSPR
jgi:hypothetical protein